VIILAVTAEHSKAKANWAEQTMSGPATSTSYDESVGSCGPSTPTTVPPPAPAMAPAAPVRRQLNFATGGGDLENNDDEFLCRAADDIERGYNEGCVRRRASAGVACARWSGMARAVRLLGILRHILIPKIIKQML
jgi:hypothetical protein